MSLPLVLGAGIALLSKVSLPKNEVIVENKLKSTVKESIKSALSVNNETYSRVVAINEIIIENSENIQIPEGIHQENFVTVNTTQMAQTLSSAEVKQAISSTLKQEAEAFKKGFELTLTEAKTTNVTEMFATLENDIETNLVNKVSNIVEVQNKFAVKDSKGVTISIINQKNLINSIVSQVTETVVNNKQFQDLVSDISVIGKVKTEGVDLNSLMGGLASGAIAILLGGLAVAGVGLYAYLKIQSQGIQILSRPPIWVAATTAGVAVSAAATTVAIMGSKSEYPDKAKIAKTSAVIGGITTGVLTLADVGMFAWLIGSNKTRKINQQPITKTTKNIKKINSKIKPEIKDIEMEEMLKSINESKIIREREEREEIKRNRRNGRNKRNDELEELNEIIDEVDD